MQVYKINGRAYRLADNLHGFQLEMYMHLVDRKREDWTDDCGTYRGEEYDIILPVKYKEKHEPIYRPIVDRILEHQRQFPFKLHKFIGHMASSQAACMNLFVPLLLQPQIAAEVLRHVKPDLASIATEHLDRGFQIEFWPGNGKEPGLLNDHSAQAGTDADIAIAYRDTAGKLKLWLIEHKLTEQEFTLCGGAKSKGRMGKHKCDSAKDVLADHGACYYHDQCKYAYWTITDRHPDVFPPDRLASGGACPFKGGTNQPRRNILIALAVKDMAGSPYADVHFSVVHHPGNNALEPSMAAFKKLLGRDDKFSSFTSDRVINAAAALAPPPPLSDWITWYRTLYNV